MSKCLLCPCEDVTLSDVRHAIDKGYRDIESIKRYTGFGTGICQGKSCLVPCAEGVQVTVARRLRRPVTVRGRAFEIGCDPATPVSDGVPHEREMKRWHWYRHTEDLLRV